MKTSINKNVVCIVAGNGCWAMDNMSSNNLRGADC